LFEHGFLLRWRIFYLRFDNILMPRFILNKLLVEHEVFDPRISVWDRISLGQGIDWAEICQDSYGTVFGWD